MRHALSALVGGLALAALAATPAHAAGLSAAEVDRAAASAMRLYDAGRADDALRLLERRLVECGADADGRACRVSLGARAGYIAERQSRAEKDGAAALRRRAAAFYEEVLRDDPGHGPTLNNLALLYRTLGSAGRGVALLQAGLGANVDMAPALAVTLGDLLRDEQKADEALAAYHRALREDPDDAAAARRLVDLYLEVIPARIDELPRLLADWSRRSTLDEVVEYGHRSIVQTAHASAEPLALRSLVAWVELSARRRWITTTSLAWLPAAWRHPAVVELGRYMGAPEQPPSAGWWGQDMSRRNALAAVALALGHERLGRGDAARAAARWKAGNTIAPPYTAYAYRPELKGAWMVRADLQSELASLYFKYPALDPQGHEFSRVLRDLYGGKGDVIQLGDQEAMQRFHTVLGLIFAQRGEWKTPRNYLGALFQLDAAIRAAGAREKERGPQPLPELKALLAEGYVAARLPAEARAMYVQAAAAYLDTDNLVQARDSLDHARRVGGARLPQEPALERIARSRSAIAGAPLAGVAEGVRTAPEHAWIFGAGVPGVSAEFLSRQRFKALADLSTRARDLHAEAVATRYAAEALNNGVKDVKALIDFGDLARLRHVRNLVTVPVRLDQSTGKTQEKTWLLSIPGEATPRQVGVSPEVVVAARVIDALGADHALLARDAGALTIQGGRVRIDTPDGAVARAAATRLTTVDGISNVNVRAR